MKELISKDLGMVEVNGTRRHMVVCMCEDCSKEVTVRLESIKKKEFFKCSSCGSKLKNKRHGMSNSKLYTSWNNMLARCTRNSYINYKRYGGRGITICNEWLKFNPFKEWALGSGYKEGLTLDRINNDGNYEPSNCRWVTRNVQNRNTIKLQSNNTSGYRGVSMDKKANKWAAQIRLFNKNKFLGYFDTKLEAAKAYDNYVIENNLEHTINNIT